MRLDLLQEQRLIVQAQLDWTNQEIEKAYSFYDKGRTDIPGRVTSVRLVALCVSADAASGRGYAHR
jgi:hypothetical protein